MSLCALLSHLGRVLLGTSGRSSPAPCSPSLLWELSQSARLRLTLKVEISGSSQPCGRDLLGKTHFYIEHLLPESQNGFLPFLGDCTMNPLRNVTVNGSGYVSIYFILSRCFTKTIFREKNGLLRSNNLLGCDLEGFTGLMCWFFRNWYRAFRSSLLLNCFKTFLEEV